MAERPEWQEAKYGMYLYAPYNEEFAEEMKRAVPFEERKWDPLKKAWWISDPFLDDVDSLLQEHFEGYYGANF